MAVMINLNADMAEGFGAYRIGDDAALLKIVKSASIACGFHGGDPVIMHEVVALAKASGVSIGAHPAFNDLWGFGRRRIEMKAAELEYMVAYQIGALQALAAYAEMPVTHVKAHGALYNMAAESEDYALAIGHAIKTVDPGLVYVVLPGSEMEKAGRRLGLAVAREGFCDRLYEDDGSLTPRKIAGAVIRDPEVAARQAVRIAVDKTVASRTGKEIACAVETLCLHGDEPGAAMLAASVREALEAAGVTIAPIPELI